MALFVILVETISQIFGETMTTQLKGIINATLVGRKNAEQKQYVEYSLLPKKACADDGWFKQPHLAQSDWTLGPG